MRQKPVTLLPTALVALLFGVTDPLLSAEPEAPVKITLHPAAQPTPALKYRLLPGRLDQIAGNAAVYYGKVTAEEMGFFGNRDLRENIDQWQETPLEELRLSPVHLPSDGSIEFSLRRAARCRYCDWQLPIGDVPFYEMMLPEVQQTREFARILAVRARLQVADGKFEDAIETLQAGYALGRNVATGETLVNGLVGIAICQAMSRQVLDFVQQSDAPNLYWALTMLPRPLIELRDAADVEAMGVELSFPELDDLENAHRSPDEWRELFHRFATQAMDWTATADSAESMSPDELDALCEKKLPVAKQAVVEGGLPAKQVETMSMYQVALLYSVQTYHELLDEGIKYYFLPYPQASVGIDAAVERAEREQREILPLATRLLPAIQSTRIAVVRNDRQIAVLRVMEALRIYGALHDASLPQKLADVTEVPIPHDPVTGKPFVYRLDGEKAILQGPTLRGVLLNYEVTMSRP